MPNNLGTPAATHGDQLVINEKEYVGLGINQVIVGVESQQILSNGQPPQEIITREDGYRESRNLVEGKEIYNLRNPKHRNWFILDLETGSRGWFPGSKIKGTVAQADLRAGPGDSYTSLGILTNVVVEVLEITRINQEPVNEGWYKVKFSNEGYIKVEEITNLHYE